MFISPPTVKEEDDLFRVGSSHVEMKRVSVQESLLPFRSQSFRFPFLKSKKQILKYGRQKNNFTCFRLRLKGKIQIWLRLRIFQGEYTVSDLRESDIGGLRK